MDRQTLGEMDLPAHIWEPFAQSRAAIRCSPGFLIYLQGTEATCFYYLKEGQVRSFIQSEDGAERALNVYGPGSLFGEASFFDELPRVSSAVALTSCEIVAIDRELVTEEIEKDPELAFRPAQWRIARYLLSLSPTGGPVRCTQEDIASSVSASRVTVSRVLNQLARQGIIELGYSTIFVWDIEALKKTCQI